MGPTKSHDESGIDSATPFHERGRRVRFAIRKYHGIDEEGDGWTMPEIANELDVSKATVSRYINNTSYGSHVAKEKGEQADELNAELVMDLRDRLDKLQTIEMELYDAVEPIVTEYSMEEVTGKPKDIDFESGTIEVEDGSTVETSVPVPQEWKEVPQFDRLQSVWEERRRVEEQITQLLGLNDPDELELSGSIYEGKVWQFEDGDGETIDEPDYPQQEVVEVDSEAERERRDGDGQ